MLERRHAGFLRLLVLAADIDLAGGVTADQYHRKPGRKPVLPLHSRDLIGDAGAKLGGDAFSIDDAGRHLNPCPLALVLCPGPLPDPLTSPASPRSAFA